MNYYSKYLKYKAKYINLYKKINQIGGDESDFIKNNCFIIYYFINIAYVGKIYNNFMILDNFKNINDKYNKVYTISKEVTKARNRNGHMISKTTNKFDIKPDINENYKKYNEIINKLIMNEFQIDFTKIIGDYYRNKLIDFINQMFNTDSKLIENLNKDIILQNINNTLPDKIVEEFILTRLTNPYDIIYYLMNYTYIFEMFYSKDNIEQDKLEKILQHIISMEEEQILFITEFTKNNKAFILNYLDKYNKYNLEEIINYILFMHSPSNKILKIRDLIL